MQVYRHYSQVPWDSARWPNFSPRELACRGTGKVAIDEDALDKLQHLRTVLGRPIILNSAYRSPEHNRAVGGAKGSQHLKAKAFDVSMSNHEPGRFEHLARSVGFTGFGFYRRNNFIHIDTGREREWGTRWFDVESRVLPVEKPLQPETAASDKGVQGAVAAVAGMAAAAGPVVSAVSEMAPAAQLAAVGGVVVVGGGCAYVLYSKFKDYRR